MFLKSIDLFGFKSFAESSRIELNAGITALLGPNGCGKSNVVDAIKWVLGEQSAKNLRADGMEGVIFNGTENRKAVNVAEVTLTLDNESRRFPLDYTEIAVKRRLFRNGDSEYYINNKPARLRELRELFYDTGVGKSAYSVLEQGKIDQILSSKPEERRLIFEEAAGISRHKQRAEEGEKKLRNTRDNLEKLDGIIKEVKRGYDSLKIQADKAERFRQLNQAIFDVDLKIQLKELRSLLEKKQQLAEQIDKLEKKRGLEKEKVARLQQLSRHSLAELNQMETALVETQKKVYGLNAEREGKIKQADLHRERLEEIERSMAAGRQRGESLTKKIDSLGSEIDQKEKELNQMRQEINETESNIRLFETNLKKVEQKISDNEKKISGNEKDIGKAGRQIGNLQKELADLTEIIVAQLDQKLKDTGYSQKKRHDLALDLEHKRENLASQAKGKLLILRDRLNLPSHSQAEWVELLKSAVIDLEEIVGGLAEIKQLFVDYQQTIPAFIDDFLAPDGTISKKRRIDEQIQANQELAENRREENRLLRQENQQLGQDLNNCRKTLEKLRLNRMQMITRERGFHESLKLLARNRASQQSHLAENQKELARARQKTVEFNRQLKRLAAETEQLAAAREKLKNRLTTLEKEIAKKNSQILAEEGRREKINDRLEQLQEQHEKLNIQHTQRDMAIQNLYTNFKDKYSRDLSDYDSRTFDSGHEQVDFRQELARHRSEQKNLGQINLMAPKEFANVKERYDFLTSQKNDLLKAQEDLKQITDRIQSESIEIFLESFHGIRKNFHHIFRRLFGGGRAEIKLVDPKEVLSSGVDILVQPPGKKLENLALLSGGERSMTAVALLFSLFMVKPSPFCLLDEIDAALDEQNVSRFTDVLQEFSQRSQFIVVTHNKRTITCAQSLIGVTMEESGVSRLVSIKLAEDKLA